MHVGDFVRDYEEGATVISPYGLAVVKKLHQEPFKERPEQDETGATDMVAADIWVNGHGTETIEVDQLIPATPDNMARWNLQQWSGDGE